MQIARVLFRIAAAAGDHLHFLDRKAWRGRRSGSTGSRRGAGSRLLRAGGRARSGSGRRPRTHGAGRRRRPVVRAGSRDPYFMSHMRAQLGGVAGEVVSLAGIIGQREIAGGTIQAAFNRVFGALGGRGGRLAGRRSG